MAKVIPFKGIRPIADKAALVPSLSVESYTKAQIQSEITNNPYSYLNVILPDYTDGKRTKHNSNERLLKIKSKLHTFVQQGVLIQDKQPCFYIYKQTKNNLTFTGIIGCSSIDDYFDGVIKGHEQTLVEREKKLQHYLDVCEINAEPVLFAYPDDNTINSIVTQKQKQSPEYDFISDDGIQHQLWLINETESIATIMERFSKTPNLYIADGHHRTASSALLGKKRREHKKQYTGKEAFNFFMGIYFPESELKIYEYNRLIKDLNGLQPQQLIKKISEVYSVNEMGTMPLKKHTFGMYLSGQWYRLIPKHKTKMLDALLLSETILHPILNIGDERKDNRLAYFSGTKGLDALKAEIDAHHYKLGFVLHPISMNELKTIANNNQFMPPKTTWIEPKIRSGMVVYSLK